MRGHETQINRRLTQRFIETAPVHLRLTPYERLADDQGSWRFIKGEIRTTQKFRLIEGGSDNNAATQVTNIDGLVREIEFVLLGEHDAEVTLYDRFTWDGVEYEVTQIWPDNGYEKRASVRRRG